jgi:hypothetical protein
MDKDERSEVKHCCQAFANFSASVTKLISHIFCINFAIVNFVMYKRFNYNLCHLNREKLAAETCQDLAALYKTGISVQYSAQCKRTSEFRVQICLKSFIFNFACSSISTFIIFAYSSLLWTVSVCIVNAAKGGLLSGKYTFTVLQKPTKTGDPSLGSTYIVFTI